MIKCRKIKQIAALLILIAFYFPADAQQLSGLWYSADSSRIYEIDEAAANEYCARIKYSNRKTDSIGYMVLRDLHFNKRKKYFEGLMFSVADGQPAFAKIRMNKNADRLRLKLDRLFLLDVVITWTRIKPGTSLEDTFTSHSQKP